MTRDMTDREFRAALRRRGWRWCVGWVNIPSPETGGTRGIGCIMTKKGGKWTINKRATLARAIREAEGATS